MDVRNLAENRGYEQFFFNEESLLRLAEVVSDFSQPCLLCAPTLGAELESRGRQCRILDIDMRFSGLKGFKFFDLHRPVSLGESYDLVLCDPPFGLDVLQVFKAVDLLKGENTTIIVSWYQSRLKQFLQVFSKLGLISAGITLMYRNREIPFYNSEDALRFGKVWVKLYSNDPARVRRLWASLDR